MEIVFFDKEIEEFLTTLPIPARTKASRTIDLLEEFGPSLRPPQSKHLEDNLFELRIRGTIEVRIIYMFHNHKAVLLHGFVKKSDKIPPKELLTARRKSCNLDAL